MGLRGRLAAVVLLGFACAVTASGSSAAGNDPASRTALIRVHKTAHVMDVVAQSGEVTHYPVSLGPGGPGVKHREGDMVTPTGRYKIVGSGPSQFKVFMRLDYPNAEDRRRFARLKAAGELPAGATIGGDIGIHGGTPAGFNHDPDRPLPKRDWTLGCVGVEDAEIVDIARRTAVGTPVEIDDQ